VLAGLYCPCSDCLAAAQPLAVQLDLPLLTQRPSEACLFLDAAGLALLPAGGMGPVRVDFVGGSLGHRRRFGGGRRQTIARAIGLGKGSNPRVIDATAGLGRDAFVLASLGARVRLIERSAPIAALLDDGLQRALKDAELMAWVGERMQLHCGDARVLLPRLAAQSPADVIYLDPMYPQRKKQALVKKEMRVFRSLLGDDDDAHELLTLAIGLAGKRVVVKRPRLGEGLPGPRPNLVLQGKSTRYDIYVRAV
jgi:16S rRNA (guanine1516-N2)-methyltransferase